MFWNSKLTTLGIFVLLLAAGCTIENNDLTSAPKSPLTNANTEVESSSQENSAQNCLADWDCFAQGLADCIPRKYSFCLQMFGCNNVQIVGIQGNYCTIRVWSETLDGKIINVDKTCTVPKGFKPTTEGQTDICALLDKQNEERLEYVRKANQLNAANLAFAKSLERQGTLATEIIADLKKYSEQHTNALEQEIITKLNLLRDECPKTKKYMTEFEELIEEPPYATNGELTVSEKYLTYASTDISGLKEAFKTSKKIVDEGELCEFASKSLTNIELYQLQGKQGLPPYLYSQEP